MHKKPATKTQSLSMHQIPKCHKSFFMQNADKNSSTKPIISQESDFQGHRFLLLHDDMGANADKLDCRNPSPSVCFSLGLQNPGIATCVLKAAASKSLYREQEKKKLATEV
jgi:hypothetical protein